MRSLWSLFASALLIVVLAGPAAAQPPVVDLRGPGEAAQWTVDGGGAVDSLHFHQLYNTQRLKHLGGSANSLKWQDTRPGNGNVHFDNCTRPGEVIYGSDLVAMRFGGDFVTFRNGSPALQPSGRSYPDGVGDHGDFSACEFRLIPSGHGLVSAGSGDGKFALYSTRGNRYLVYKELFLDFGWLRWQETASGQPPGGVAARADFVPVDLFFTSSPSPVYLTIKNIGNVASSASQNEMQVRINGQPGTFVILRPIPPGGTERNPLRFQGPLCDHDQILVELDTNPKLKFQVLQGAFPNDDVFANDRKTMSARSIGSAAPEWVPYAACSVGVFRAPAFWRFVLFMGG